MDKKNKIIKDLVHEYVEIDEKIQKIVDTKEFQRLKRVKQLTAIYIYPSANHTRFEHSLGVMKLAMDYYASIEEKLRGIVTKNVVKEDIESKLQYYKVNLQIAALLHDLGHAPFSHLGEKFFDKKEIKDKIKVTLKEEEANRILDGNDGAPHELMSCFCIKKLESKLKEIYGSDYDYEFICRIITGKLYSEPEKDWKVKNVMISIVNSNSIDVDKLDYLLRDNHMCGYPTAKIDLYRFFRSVELDEDDGRVYFKPSGVPVIQTIVDSRDSLYIWGYNHHLAVYTDAIIERVLEMNKKSLKEKYFSTTGITQRLASDEDIWVFLKERYFELNTTESPDNEEEKELLSQIFSRQLLKPLWKTLYQYNDFLKQDIKDERVINNNFKKSEYKDLKKYLQKLEESIKEKLKLNAAELLIVERSNKFYYGTKGKEPEIYVRVGKEEIELSTLLPQKKFEDFTKIAFYVFTKPDEKKDVKAALKELIKKREDVVEGEDNENK